MTACAPNPSRKARQLRLPGCDRPMAYALQYWPSTLRHMLRSHRLRAPAEVPRLQALVQIPPRLRADWEALFDADSSCPLLTNQSVGTLLYTRLFGQLGLNFRHLLHLQHRSTHVESPEAFAAAHVQVLVCSLAGCWRLRGDNALVTLQTQIRRPAAEGGALLAEVEDCFMIRRVPARDLQALPPLQDRTALRALLGLGRRQAELDIDAAGVRTLPLQLRSDLGRRYGKVSGDYNPAHTTALAARLFGLPAPFAQGLALRNLIVSRLHGLDMPLQQLRLTFARPAWLGQALRLVLEKDRFELLDAQQRVLVFGNTAA